MSRRYKERNHDIHTWRAVTACGEIDVELSSIRTRPSWPHSAARCRIVRRCYKQ